MYGFAFIYWQTALPSTANRPEVRKVPRTATARFPEFRKVSRTPTTRFPEVRKVSCTPTGRFRKVAKVCRNTTAGSRKKKVCKTTLNTRWSVIYSLWLRRQETRDYSEKHCTFAKKK